MSRQNVGKRKKEEKETVQAKVEEVPQQIEVAPSAKKEESEDWKAKCETAEKERDSLKSSNAELEASLSKLKEQSEADR